MYNLLKIHNLNVLSVKIKRKYKRFEMKHPNELIQQMDTKGPLYLKGSRNKHTILFMLYRRLLKKSSEQMEYRRNSEKTLLSVFKE
jgi:hypothetical protein